LNTVIIDYNLCNLFSVQHACRASGIEAVISSEKNEVEKAEAIILPGVGAFGDAMENLGKLDLVQPLRDAVAAGKPLFGICLGLQLFFSSSEEFGSHRGLDLVAGEVKRFSPGAPGSGIKVPQIGWNTIQFKKDKRLTPLEPVADNEYMYFVHSYYVAPRDTSVVLTETEYGGTRYCSSVMVGNVFGVQFHPEKSGPAGLAIYDTWKKYCNEQRSR
jgi:glutamine amidotransferase